MPARRFLPISPASSRQYVGRPHRELDRLPADPEVVARMPPPDHDLVARIAEARDIVDEPEAVGPAVADGFGQVARRHAELRHLAAIEAGEAVRRELTVDERVAAARLAGKRQRVDVSGDLFVVVRAVERARRGGRQVPVSALERLARVEARLDGKPDGLAA